MFDEGRYFASGNAIQAFNTQFGRLGLLICEEFWHVSPPYLLWLDGADLLIHTSSAPESEVANDQLSGSAKRVELFAKTYATIFTNFVINVNRTGTEDGAIFYGGSTIFGPEGNQIIPSTYNEEGLFTADLDWTQLHRARIRLPLLRDERSELTARELRRILNSQ
jgi:predicted amidohydrolase